MKSGLGVALASRGSEHKPREDKTSWPSFEAWKVSGQRHTPEDRQAHLCKYLLYRRPWEDLFQASFRFSSFATLSLLLSQHTEPLHPIRPKRIHGKDLDTNPYQTQTNLSSQTTMHPLVSIFAFLGLALAAPTQNNTTTTTLTMVTNPTTVPHASPSTTTSTVPSSTPCPILIENTPWLLTNITHFTPSFPSQNHSNSNSSTTSFSASSPSSSPSLSTSSFSTSLTSRFISFHFRDTNKGLKLETRCFRTLPRRHSDEVDEKPGGGTYYPCEDGRVRFAYTPTVEGKGEGEGEGELKVGRGYRDDW